MLWLYEVLLRLFRNIATKMFKLFNYFPLIYKRSYNNLYNSFSLTLIHWWRYMGSTCWKKPTHLHDLSTCPTWWPRDHFTCRCHVSNPGSSSRSGERATS